MATQSSNGKSTKAKPKAKSAPKAKAKAAEKGQVQSVAQAVVDLPVGVVLNVSDRVTELVEPFTGRSGAEKQLKSYRTQLRRRVKRTERRGATARRKATTEARPQVAARPSSASARRSRSRPPAPRTWSTARRSSFRLCARASSAAGFTKGRLGQPGRSVFAQRPTTAIGREAAGS